VWTEESCVNRNHIWPSDDASANDIREGSAARLVFQLGKELGSSQAEPDFRHPCNSPQVKRLLCSGRTTSDSRVRPSGYEAVRTIHLRRAFRAESHTRQRFRPLTVSYWFRSILIVSRTRRQPAEPVAHEDGHTGGDADISIRIPSFQSSSSVGCSYVHGDTGAVVHP
jgi:hypothetical protein